MGPERRGEVGLPSSLTSTTASFLGLADAASSRSASFWGEIRFKLETVAIGDLDAGCDVLSCRSNRHPDFVREIVDLTSYDASLE